jgi:hypothetical protein
MMEMKNIGTHVGLGLMGKCPRCHGDIDLDSPSTHRCYVQKQWVRCEIGPHGEIRIEASSRELIDELHSRIAVFGVIVP